MDNSFVRISRQLAILGVMAIAMSLGTLFTLSLGGGVSYMSSTEHVRQALVTAASVAQPSAAEEAWSRDIRSPGARTR